MCGVGDNDTGPGYVRNHTLTMARKTQAANSVFDLRIALRLLLFIFDFVLGHHQLLFMFLSLIDKIGNRHCRHNQDDEEQDHHDLLVKLVQRRNNVLIHKFIRVAHSGDDKYGHQRTHDHQFEDTFARLKKRVK